MNTLYLDPESWDLALDAEGNIALSAMPHAQDVPAPRACLPAKRGTTPIAAFLILTKRWAAASRLRCTATA